MFERPLQKHAKPQNANKVSDFPQSHDNFLSANWLKPLNRQTVTGKLGKYATHAKFRKQLQKKKK